MGRGTRHRVLLGIAALLVAGAIAWVVGAQSHSAATPPASGTAAVEMPGDRFAPNVTVVQEGGRVTFHNADSDEHTVTSIPGDPMAFNLVVKPGDTVTLDLRRSGVYRFYCSIHASYDAATGQFAARQSSDHPDEPMSGVVVAEPR